MLSAISKRANILYYDQKEKKTLKEERSRRIKKKKRLRKKYIKGKKEKVEKIINR